MGLFLVVWVCWCWCWCWHHCWIVMVGPCKPSSTHPTQPESRCLQQWEWVVGWHFLFWGGLSMSVTSDVHGSAQSRKPAEAEPKKAEPCWAVMMAWEGLWLGLRVWKAISRGLSCGSQRLVYWTWTWTFAIVTLSSSCLLLSGVSAKSTSIDISSEGNTLPGRK